MKFKFVMIFVLFHLGVYAIDEQNTIQPALKPESSLTNSDIQKMTVEPEPTTTLHNTQHQVDQIAKEVESDLTEETIEVTESITESEVEETYTEADEEIAVETDIVINSEALVEAEADLETDLVTEDVCFVEADINDLTEEQYVCEDCDESVEKDSFQAETTSNVQNSLNSENNSLCSIPGDEIDDILANLSLEDIQQLEKELSLSDKARIVLAFLKFKLSQTKNNVTHHMQENKKIYLAVGASVAAGIILYIVQQKLLAQNA